MLILIAMDQCEEGRRQGKEVGGCYCNSGSDESLKLESPGSWRGGDEFLSYLQGGRLQDFSAGIGNWLFIFRNNPCVVFVC